MTRTRRRPSNLNSVAYALLLKTPELRKDTSGGPRFVGHQGVSIGVDTNTINHAKKQAGGCASPTRAAERGKGTMGRLEKWIVASIASLVLGASAFLIVQYGVIASSEAEPICYPPPRRHVGTVLEVSPTLLVLDEGKDRMGRYSSVRIGFVCKPSACAQLGGVVMGDKIEAIFGATAVSGRRPLVNELLEVRVGEPENRDMDFEPAPCMGAAEVTAASLMRQKDTAPWPKTGVFAGYYRRGFEVSDFRPAGTKEQWWLSGERGMESGLPRTAPFCSSAPCYVVVRGNLSGLGRHGHLGAYNRELRVTEVIEQRPLNSDEKVTF